MAKTLANNSKSKDVNPNVNPNVIPPKDIISDNTKMDLEKCDCLVNPLFEKYADMYNKCQDQEEYKRMLEEDKTKLRNDKKNKVRKSIGILVKFTN